MQGVTVVDHPLVQHKLTLMRDKTRSTKVFRELFGEIGALLCYEVTRDLPLENVEIETPFATMKSPVLAGKKLVLAPIGGPAWAFSKACSNWCRRRASRISDFTAIRGRSSPSNISSRRQTIWPSV